MEEKSVTDVHMGTLRFKYEMKEVSGSLDTAICMYVVHVCMYVVHMYVCSS